MTWILAGVKVSAALVPRGFDVDMVWCEGGVSGSVSFLLLKSLKTAIHTRNGRKNDGGHFIR